MSNGQIKMAQKSSIFQHLAFSKDEHDSLSAGSIHRLVSATLSPIENQPNKIFSLRLLLGCGAGSITGLDREYIIRLRQCYVDIITDNCTAIMDNAYSYELSKDTISSHQSKLLSEDNDKGLGTSGEFNAKIGIKDKIAFSLKNKLQRESKSNNKASMGIDIKHRIMLISCNGTFWTVGDEEYSDPRNKSGVLWERYFNEDGSRPLCLIKLNDLNPAKVRIIVRVKFGQLDARLPSSYGHPTGHAVDPFNSDLVMAIKARVRGISIAKALKEQQMHKYPELPPSEVVVAYDNVIVIPQTE